MAFNSREKKRFSVVARAQSFTHAFRGIRILCATQHNIWIQALLSVLVVILGFWWRISTTEWCMLIFAIGGVFVTEAVNTAFEIDIDLTSPEYHPFARDTKDIAAGAVLIAGIVALLVGSVIFVPKLLPLIVK